MTNEFNEWLNTRPKLIQQLAKKYPPGEYIIKKGAPYRFSCEDTRVSLHSYLENGNIRVLMKAENKLPETILQEVIAAWEYNKTPKELNEIRNSDIIVEIEPVYLVSANKITLKVIQEYLKTKIAEEQLEWIGDFREEDGEYFFTIKLPFLRKVDFTNSIFTVVDVDAGCSQGCHIKLKVETNFLNYLVTNP